MPSPLAYREQVAFRSGTFGKSEAFRERGVGVGNRGEAHANTAALGRACWVTSYCALSLTKTLKDQGQLISIGGKYEEAVAVRRPRLRGHWCICTNHH